MNKRIIGAAITAAVVIAAAGTAVAATGTGGTASDYTPAAPVRLADTVPAHQVGPVKGPIGAGKTLTVALTGVPANATAVVVNVTATGPTVSGFLTAYGDGASRPATSTVNFAAGQTIANQATLPVSNGKIDVFNSAGSTNIVVDLEGYYTPAAPAYVPPSITKWTLTGHRHHQHRRLGRHPRHAARHREPLRRHLPDQPRAPRPPRSSRRTRPRRSSRSSSSTRSRSAPPSPGTC